jgi:hypothetical protein
VEDCIEEACTEARMVVQKRPVFSARKHMIGYKGNIGSQASVIRPKPVIKLESSGGGGSGGHLSGGMW